MIAREILVSNNNGHVMNRSKSSNTQAAATLSGCNMLTTRSPRRVTLLFVALTLLQCSRLTMRAEAATTIIGPDDITVSGTLPSPILVSGSSITITAAAGSIIPCITVSGIINGLTITSTGGTFSCASHNVYFDNTVTFAVNVKIGGNGVAMTSTGGNNIYFAGVALSAFVVTFGANGATFSSFTASANPFSNFLIAPTLASSGLQMTFQSTTLSAKRYNLYVQNVTSSGFVISTAATVSLSVTSSGAWDTANVYLYACAGGGSGTEAHVTLGGVSIVGQVDTNTAYSGNLVMRLSKYIIAQLDAGITTLKFTSTAAAAPTFFYGGNAVVAEQCTGLGLSIMSSMTFVANSRAVSYGGANVYIDATATATITSVSLYHSATLSNIAMIGDNAFANFVFAGTIQGLTFGAGGGSTTTLSMIGGAALPLYNVYGATTLSITASSLTFNPVVVSAANVNFLFNHAVPTATPVFYLDDFTIKMNNGGSVVAGRSLIQAVNPFRFLAISSTNVVFSLTTTSYIFVHFNTAKNTIAKSISGNAYFDGCTLLSNIRYIAFTYHVDGGTFTFTKTGQTGTAPMDFGALPSSLSIPDFALTSSTPKGIFSFVTAFTPGSANLAVVLSVAGGITVTSAGNTRSLFHVENAAPNIWVYAQDLITIQGSSLITFPSGTVSGTYTFTMQATSMVELRVPDGNIIDVGVANVVVGGTFTFTSQSIINVYSKSLLFSIGEAQALTISGVSTNFHLTAEAVTLYGRLQQSGSLSLVNSPVTCSRAFFSSQCVAGTSCSNYVDVTVTSSNILVTTTTSNIPIYLVQATSMTTYGGNFKFYTGSILYSSTATLTCYGFYFTGTTFVGQTLIQSPTATIAVNKNFFYFDSASPIGRAATNPRLEFTSATITCTLSCFSFNAPVMNTVFLWDKTKVLSSSTGGDYGVYFGNTVSVSSVRFEGSLLSPVEVTATVAGVYFSQQATSVTTTFQNAYITVTGAATTYNLYMLSCLNPAATGNCLLSFGGVNDFRSSANTGNIGQNVKIGTFVGTVYGYSSSLHMEATRENFVITANSGWIFRMALGSGVITTTSLTLNNIEISGVNLAGNYVDLEGTTIIGPRYNVLLSASACDVTMNGVSLTTSAEAANNVLVTYSSAFALFGMLTIVSSTFLGTGFSTGIPLYNNVYVYYGIISASPSSIVGTTFSGANFGIQVGSILSTPLTLATTTANCVLRSTAAPTRMGLLLAGTVGNAPVNTGAYTVSINSVTTIGTVVGGNLGTSCYQTHALWAGANANHDITLSGAQYGWSQSYKSLTFVGLEFLNARLGDGSVTTTHNLLVKGVGAQFDYSSPAKVLRSTASSNGAFAKMAITITCISMATTEFPIDLQSSAYFINVLTSSTVQIASVYFSIAPVAVHITGPLWATSLTFQSVSFHTNKMLWYNAWNAAGSPTLAVTSACSTFNDGVVTAKAYVVTNLGAMTTAFSASLCDTDANRRQCFATATKSQSMSYSQSRTPSRSGSSSQSLSRDLSQTRSASTTTTESVNQTVVHSSSVTISRSATWAYSDEESGSSSQTFTFSPTQAKLSKEHSASFTPTLSDESFSYEGSGSISSTPTYSETESALKSVSVEPSGSYSSSWSKEVSATLSPTTSRSPSATSSGTLGAQRDKFSFSSDSVTLSHFAQVSSPSVSSLTVSVSGSGIEESTTNQVLGTMSLTPLCDAPPFAVNSSLPVAQPNNGSHCGEYLCPIASPSLIDGVGGVTLAVAYDAMMAAPSVLLLLAEDGIRHTWLSLLPSVRLGTVPLDAVAPRNGTFRLLMFQPRSGWPGLDVRPYAVQRLSLVVALRCLRANGTVVSHPTEMVLVVTPRASPVAASVQAVLQSSQGIAGGLGSGGGAEALTMGRLAMSLSMLSCDDALQGFGAGQGVVSVSGDLLAAVDTIAGNVVFVAGVAAAAVLAACVLYLYAASSSCSCMACCRDVLRLPLSLFPVFAATLPSTVMAVVAVLRDASALSGDAASGAYCSIAVGAAVWGGALVLVGSTSRRMVRTATLAPTVPTAAVTGYILCDSLLRWASWSSTEWVAPHPADATLFEGTTVLWFLPLDVCMTVAVAVVSALPLSRSSALCVGANAVNVFGCAVMLAVAAVRQPFATAFGMVHSVVTYVMVLALAVCGLMLAATSSSRNGNNGDAHSMLLVVSYLSGSAAVLSALKAAVDAAGIVVATRRRFLTLVDSRSCVGVAELIVRECHTADEVRPDLASCEDTLCGDPPVELLSEEEDHHLLYSCDDLLDAYQSTVNEYQSVVAFEQVLADLNLK